MSQEKLYKGMLSGELNNIKSSLLYSRIEQNQYRKDYQDRYIIIKVAKVEKNNIQSYKQRAKNGCQNVPCIFLQQKSPFYVTVFIEKYTSFHITDLLSLPINKRKAILINILQTVMYLSKLYGFFYITQKMLGYSKFGNILLWINQNILQNKRSFPINHGKLSEQIFISDFKESFINSNQQKKQFYKTKTIQALIDRLKNNQNTYTSLYMHQSPSKFIFTDKQIPNMSLHQYDFLKGVTFNNVHNYREQHISKTTVHKSHSLNIQNKRISFSYISNQTQQQRIYQRQYRPLNTSLSSQNLMNKRISTIDEKQVSKFYRINSMSYSNLPQTQFTNNYKIDCHKQNTNLFKKDRQLSNMSSEQQNKKIFLKRSTSNQILTFKYSTQTPKSPKSPIQSLKISFPHTTTNSFAPFASNGNLNISNPYRDSCHFSYQSIELEKYCQEQKQNSYDKKIDEQSNQIQAELQILFSDQQQQQTSQKKLEEMENLIQELQNILI